MFNNNKLAVYRLPKTNLDHDYHHAILISVLRGLAAVEVFAAHLRVQLYPGLRSMTDPSLWFQAFTFFTGFAHQAVVLFFLLSGWLVGGTLLNKYRHKYSLISYGIDRLTRLWIVLIPAFVLTLLLGAAMGEADLTKASFSTTNDYSATAFIGNLFGLQDLWVSRYGGNFALWSLTNETWYYVLFPVLLTPWITRSFLARSLAAVIGIALLWYLPFPILLFFTIWLMGVGASRLNIVATVPVRLVLLTLFASVSVFFRLTGSNDKLEPDTFVQDVVLSASFLALLCSLQFKANTALPVWRRLKKVGAGLAAFSFTLYVIHVPLLLALRDLFNLVDNGRLSPDSVGDFAIYLMILAAIIGFAYLFHLPFEGQTVGVRTKLKQLLLGKRAVPPAPGAAQPMREVLQVPAASLFDTVILPMAKRMRASGKAGFPTKPDVTWLSYYVRRTRSTMRPEDFTGASCADAREFERRMAAHWTSIGRHELAAQARHFAATAQTARTARTAGQASDDVSPNVYVMF